MAGRGKNEGLSMGYRIAYRLRLIGLGLFGPAQLGESNDPKRRLEREREDKVAAARAARERREAEEAARRRVA
ncbi:hypothetical protein N865_04720 [Intrasporangium oryzae NRRL B-24470]|uniref:Uncharacterized protein n=1 Tax=Intrasporangium oryzae NRRL B-24470 TaxID=1386089 RepID=W9GFS7_9MICO|nr:hypothetical protein [Intrasporangium oryzae]EWT02734.1 hypothetical protein N865_04720 [Intrasporangium oryzae NRRL B-24470]